MVRLGSLHVVANRFGSARVQTEAQILTSAKTGLKSSLVISTRSDRFGLLQVAARRCKSFRLGSGSNRSSNSDFGQNRFEVNLGYFEAFGSCWFVLIRLESLHVVANRFISVRDQTEAQILISAKTNLKSTLVVSSRSGPNRSPTVPCNRSQHRSQVLNFQTQI